jgi:hypothetical protein
MKITTNTIYLSFLFLVITSLQFSCSFISERKMKNKVKELEEIYSTFGNDFEENLQIASIKILEASTLCSKDTSICRETGLSDELQKFNTLIDELNIQKSLYGVIKDGYSKLGIVADVDELTEIVTNIEKYIEKYPQSNKNDELYGIRDEVLYKKFWKVCELEFAGSVISSYVFDAIIPNLEAYLVIVRNEKYRKEFSDKIRELKEERDRVRENEIQEEHLKEQRELEQQAYNQQLEREKQLRAYQRDKASTFNSLASAMESRAKSIASKGHNLWCFVTKISESVVSQYESGSRTEIKKSYKFKIGGTCDTSYEYVTVTGYVSDNGYNSVTYNVTGGEKN